MTLGDRALQRHHVQGAMQDHLCDQREPERIYTASERATSRQSITHLAFEALPCFRFCQCLVGADVWRWAMADESVGTMEGEESLPRDADADVDGEVASTQPDSVTMRLVINFPWL